MVLAFIELAVRPSCLPHQLRQLGDIRRNRAAPGLYLILIKVAIEPLWFKHERCTHDDLDNQIRNRRS